MAKILLKVVGFAFLLLGLLSPEVMAQSSGLEGLHAQVRKGNKICFVDHDHRGGGSGRTKRAAKRDAIASWRSFTTLEYGKAWGHFSRAKNKQIKCSSSGYRGRKAWNCDVVAVACRYKGRTVAKKARRVRRKRIYRKRVRSSVRRHARRKTRRVRRSVRR